jgi:hypothetical protein
VATALCTELGIELLHLDAAAAPAPPTDRELFVRLWEREVLLQGCALLIHFEDSLPVSSEAMRSAVALFERLPGLVLLSSRDPVRSSLRQPLRIDVPHLMPEEQRAAWQDALGEAAPRLAEHIEQLVAHFSLGQQSIRTIAQESLAQAAGPSAPALSDSIWAGCRAQARPHLDDLAQRIESRAGWDHLVLPKAQLKVLRAIVEHKRYQGTVYQRWGFAERSGRGLGLSVLFAGGSGTGKTLAAEVLANEMRLDLYRIDRRDREEPVPGVRGRRAGRRHPAVR